MTYRRGSDGAYEVSPKEFYEDFNNVANLSGDRPIVRQVLENKGRIRALDLKFYAILGAVISGFVGNALVRLS